MFIRGIYILVDTGLKEILPKIPIMIIDNILTVSCCAYHPSTMTIIISCFSSYLLVKGDVTLALTKLQMFHSFYAANPNLS